MRIQILDLQNLSTVVARHVLLGSLLFRATSILLIMSAAIDINSDGWLNLNTLFPMIDVLWFFESLCAFITVDFLELFVTWSQPHNTYLINIIIKRNGDISDTNILHFRWIRSLIDPRCGCIPSTFHSAWLQDENLTQGCTCRTIFYYVFGAIFDI